MNGLDGLIRLNKWKLDEKRLALAELERLAERLRDQLSMLERELAAEQKIAAGSIEAGIAYGQYANGVITRRATLGKSLGEVEGQIRLALEDVAEAFRDLKKFDIVKARRDREASEKLKRLQQSQLDEMGLQLHRRSSEQAG
jgi:flagellar FliJ protein